MKASMWIMLEILLIGAILLYSTVRTNTIIDAAFSHKNCLCVCVGGWGGGRARNRISIRLFGGHFFLTLFYTGCTWALVPSPALGDALLVQCIKKFSRDPHRSSSKAPVRVENFSFNVVCKPESDGVRNMVNSKIQLWSSLRPNFCTK